MKILVTGAAGLLGRHVVTRLREEGLEVVAVTRRRRLAADDLCLDLEDPACARELPRDLDAIVHAAALVPQREAAAPAGPCLEANAAATLHLLEHAAQSGARRFVYASSIAVYGPGDGQRAQRETDEPLPSDFYGLSKLGGELLARPFAFCYGLEVQCLRLTYLYGDGMRDNTVVARFLAQARAGETLRIVRGGRDAFDFLYAADAAEAVLLALRGPAVGTWNIATGRATTVRELADIVRGVTGSNSGVASEDDGQPERVVRLDVAAAASELGFRARHDLRAGLAAWTAKSPLP